MSENGQDESAQAPRPGSNGFNPETTKSFVDRIFNLYGNLDTEKSKYMIEADAIRADMKDIYQEAKDAGIPNKELKAVVKAKLLERKAEQVRDDLEADSQDTYDMIRHALGDLADTPLGASAANQAPDAPGTPAFSG